MVANRSGGIVSLFLQSEEYVDACLEKAGGRGLRSEVRDSLTSECVLLAFQGEDDLGGVLEFLDGGIRRYEIISSKEHEFQKGTDLDGSAMAGKLGVITGPQAEV